MTHFLLPKHATPPSFSLWSQWYSQETIFHILSFFSGGGWAKLISHPERDKWEKQLPQHLQTAGENQNINKLLWH